MILVCDASALVEYILQTPLSAPIRDIIEAADADIRIPALCDVEVVSALRRALKLRRLIQDRAEEALDTYLDLPLTRYGHETLLARMLSLRDNFSAYDATYLALAEELGAPLITADQRLARAVHKHTSVLTMIE